MKRSIFYIVLIFLTTGFFADYPPDVSSFDNGLMPSQPNPGYKESIIDSTFGTTITRISDKSAFNSTSNVNAHEYSCMETWNCNGTLMILKYGNYPEMVIDGNTYDIIGRHITPRGSTWSNKQAFIMYGVAGNKFVKYDVSTKRTTTLRTFSDYSSLNYLGENHVSIDDRYTVIFGYKGDSLNLISYDIANDSIIASKYMGILDIGDANPNSINAVQMTQKGNYILVIYKAAGKGDNQGVHLYDRNLNHVRFLFSECGHADQGVDENGDEVFVGQSGGSREIFKLRYSDNTRTVVLSASKSSFAEHISCRNFKRPGWCYMSDYAESYDQDSPMANKLFALKLDGSETVEFFGWARHSNVVDYNRSAFICPNPDGTKVVFRSDWGDSASDAMINDYVATYGPSIAADSTAPSAPTGLYTSNMDRTSCTLNWTASSDDLAVSNYEIFIGNVSAGKTNLTSYDVFGLTCDADNSLSVKATDANGNWSEASTVVVATTLACDNEAPSAPTNVLASEIGSSSCKLTWTASSDNVMVTEYSIYIDSVFFDKTSSLSATLSSLDCETNYSITITAHDANGNISSHSIPITLATLACKVNIALNKTVSFSSEETSNTGAMATDGKATTRWAASSGAANEWITVDLGAEYKLSGAEIMWENSDWIYKYKIETSNDNSKWKTELDHRNNTYSGQFEKVSFYAYNKRYIRLTITGWGNGGFWSSLFEFRVFENTIEDLIPPSAPAELALTESTISKTSFQVSWTASTDNIEVEDYELFKDGVSVGTTYSTSKYITNLSCETAYSITVKARDVVGNWSDESAALIVNTADCVTGTNQVSETKEVSVYPNPANKNITIENLEDETNITIFSIDGKLVYQRKHIKSGILKLSIPTDISSEWNSGLYLIKIQSKNNSITKKIVIK